MATSLISIRAFANALVPFVQATTLSSGSFAILLDQDSSGITVTFAYERDSRVGFREASVYCEAVEHLIEHARIGSRLSAILVTQYKTLPTTLVTWSSVCSRHAILISWDDGVWVVSKTTKAQMVTGAKFDTLGQNARVLGSELSRAEDTEQQ